MSKYRVDCPYHTSANFHEVESENWDEIEEEIEKCRQKASDSQRGAAEAHKPWRPVPQWE